MSARPASKQEMLRALRQSFLARLPEMIRQVEAACAGEGDAVHEAHNLSGTAGTFGLPGVSAAARALEAVLRSPSPEPESVSTHLARLREAAGLER